MKRCKRRTAGILACAVLTTVLSLFSAAAQTPFGEFRLDASGIDKPSREISVDIYQRDEAGKFQVSGASQYTCTFNRATGDASFFIQANTEGVWVSVDYLTDLNGDGTYELLDDPDAPVWDVMDSQGRLFRPKAGDAAPTLTPGQPCLLTPDTLLARSQQAVQERGAGGSHALDAAQGTAAGQEFPLCMLKLHHTDPATGEDEALVFYLQIYDSVLVPFDVSPADPYYDAVNYVLSKGYFSGVGNGLFSPEGQLARAHLAQVLWTMAGSPTGAASRFPDVPDSEWFYSPVSWCQQKELILGYASGDFGPMDFLSREQMVVILYRYAKTNGASLTAGGDLSRFSDADKVSSWAQEEMRWAVSHNLLPNAGGGTLAPQELVTRGELASVIYACVQNLGLR